MVSNFNSVLQQVKKHGYWWVNFSPTEPLSHDPVDFAKLINIFKNSSIKLTGWEYPRQPANGNTQEACYNNNDQLEAWVNHDYFKEVWRFFRNTYQFIQLLALPEDYYHNSVSDRHPYRKIKAGEKLDIIMAIHTVTEVFLFIRNLFIHELYTSDMNVQIQLRNSLDRSLFVSGFNRGPFVDEYKRKGNADIILPSEVVTSRDASNIEIFLAKARRQIIELLQQFNYLQPSDELIRADQERLLRRT